MRAAAGEARQARRSARHERHELVAEALDLLLLAALDAQAQHDLARVVALGALDPGMAHVGADELDQPLGLRVLAAVQLESLPDDLGAELRLGERIVAADRELADRL